MMDDGFRMFLASYNYQGKRWCLNFPATGFEDAKARLAQMALGNIEGELKGSFPASVPGASLWVRMIVTIRNIFRPGH